MHSQSGFEWTEMKRKSERTILDRYCCNETNKFLSSGSITLSGFIFPSTGSFCPTFSDHTRAKIWQSQALMVANIELWQKDCRICVSKLRMTFLFLEIPCYLLNPQVSTPNKYLLFDLFVTNRTQRATSMFWNAWFSRSKVTSSKTEIFTHWMDSAFRIPISHGDQWERDGKKFVHKLVQDLDLALYNIHRLIWIAYHWCFDPKGGWRRGRYTWLEVAARIRTL